MVLTKYLARSVSSLRLQALSNYSNLLVLVSNLFCARIPKPDGNVPFRTREAATEDGGLVKRIRAWIAGLDTTRRPVIENGGKKPPLSVALVETILLGLALILGSNTFVTLIAQWSGLTFKTYALISLLVTLSCLAATFLLRLKDIRKVTDRDYGTLAGLLLLGVACAVLASAIKTSTRDGAYYVSNAVYFLDHPNEPMDFAIHFLIGSRGATIISPFQGTSVSYDYFRAVVASFLHLNFLDLFYFFGVLAAFMLPLVYFLLIYQFSKDAGRALTGTAFCMALILISLDGGNVITSHNGRSIGKLAIWYSFYGKFIVLPIGVPLFVALSIKFFALPSLENWIFLSAVSMSMVGMSATAMLLIPLLSGVLFVAAVLAMIPTPGYLQGWRAILLTGVAYFSSLGMLVSYALYLFIRTRAGGITGDSFELAGLVSFVDHLRYFSDPNFLFTPLLIVVSLILTQIYLRGWLRRFVLSWAALLTLFFLNPAATAILVDILVPRNIYWRLFYLLPFPLGLALVLMHWTAKHRKIQTALALGVMVLGVAVHGMVANSQGILSFSLTEIHDRDRLLAQEVTDVAPAGVMLAPSNLNTLIPMLDGFHPQASIRPDGLRLWLEREDANLRLRATKLVDGDPDHIRDFRRLLKQNMVRTVVVRNAIFNTDQAGAIQTILRQNGFVNQELVGPYLVAWR